MKLLVAGSLVASMFLALPSAAVAAPAALSGIGQVTHVSDCPHGLKLPIEGTRVAGNTWTFTVAGIHLGCVIAYGSPISFSGVWDPQTGGPCDPLTGGGCPQSIDPNRPGFIALGAVPATATLTMTSLRLCVRDRCWEGVAFVERV